MEALCPNLPQAKQMIWKEWKIGLRCRRLLSDLPVWASGALVSILLALVTLDLAFLRGAFSFVGLSSHAWCLNGV